MANQDFAGFDKSIIFGMANITMELPDGKTIKFDGKATGDGTSFLQVEGGEFTYEPELTDIKFEDTGASNIDDRVVGANATLKLTAGQETLRLLEVALAGVTNIKSTEGDEVIGLTDAPLGASNRQRSAKVTIHPRQLPESDKSMDITIYKAASKSGFTRAYKNEQGTFDIELQAYPRDGFDMSKPGNFFYVGPTDPNAE